MSEIKAKLCQKCGRHPVLPVYGPTGHASYTCAQCGSLQLFSATDKQVGGNHYRERKIQPVEFIEANRLPFLEGCVVKRVTRHSRDGGKGRQDIEKAIHELQLILQLRYGGYGND